MTEDTIVRRWILSWLRVLSSVGVFIEGKRNFLSYNFTHEKQTRNVFFPRRRINYVIINEEENWRKLSRWSWRVERKLESWESGEVGVVWNNSFSYLVWNLIHFDAGNISVTSTSVGYNRRDVFVDTATTSFIDRICPQEINLSSSVNCSYER